MTRTITWIFLAILIVLQIQLWWGRGSIPNVMQLRESLVQQTHKNQQLVLSNQRLEAELHDLKQGQEMVEERARHDIGMVKQGEIFVQYSRTKP